MNKEHQKKKKKDKGVRNKFNQADAKLLSGKL